MVTQISQTYAIEVFRPARVTGGRSSRNQPPSFVEGTQTVRSVAENTPAGQNIGEPSLPPTQPTTSYPTPCWAEMQRGST